jgi:hypothetical protein
MRDITSPEVLWLKAGLFLVIAAASAGLIFAELPTLRTAVLLARQLGELPRVLFRLLRHRTLRGPDVSVLGIGFSRQVCAEQTPRENWKA